MPEYRDNEGLSTRTVYVEERKNRTGAIIGGIAVVAIILVLLLFATGFWSAKVQGGELPKVNVTTKSGELPDVSVHSKEVVVGTSKTTVDVPKVETKKTTIDVPTVGVRDNHKN